jgi:hypothetical protein
MKQLNINGLNYAAYEIENGILFIKMLIAPIKGKKYEGQAEDMLITLIKSVEKCHFDKVGYLNI